MVRAVQAGAAKGAKAKRNGKGGVKRQKTDAAAGAASGAGAGSGAMEA